MKCVQFLNFAILFIAMGITEAVVFREQLLGYSLFFIGLIVTILESLDN